MPSASSSRPESVARPALKVAAATLCSRVLGLGREAVSAALFGAGFVADAFVFAFRIPNLLRDFFAEGALAAAFVPAFTQARERDGEARAFELARRVFGTLASVTGAIALLGIVFAPAVVSVIAWDAPPRTQELTVPLTRWLFPFLPLVALAAVAMGVLNASRRYFLPALAPAFLNLVAVLGGAVLLAVGLPAEEAVFWWAGLVVLGGALQFLVQWPALRAVGMRGAPRMDLRLRDPDLRAIVRRMGPVVLSLAATNLMLLVTTALASREVGWAASLNYAFRLVHLPIGLVGVALGTVVLAAGARRQAARDEAGLLDVARRGLRLAWFLALPAATGLFVLAEPVVTLVYRHGAFGASAVDDVSGPLRAYAAGVVFYAGVKAAAPLFLARGDTRTPMRCSLLGIGVHLVVALVGVGSYGAEALAFAVSAGAATNYVALRLAAARGVGRGAGPQWGHLGRVAFASAAMGGLCLLARAWLSGDGAPASWGGLALRTAGVIGGAAGAYVLACRVLGVAEARALGRRAGRA
jgi:putative peptidoglycan lipid II flippase